MAEPRRALRVMADANILIAGILFPRWFHEFVRHALRRDFKLVLSQQIIREASDRIARSGLAAQEAWAQFLEDCDYELVPNPSADDVRENWNLVRDPKDVPIVLAAIAAEVDHLVSNDKDLTAQDDTTALLRQRLTPLTVGRFLHEVMGWSSADLEQIRERTWRTMGPIAE